MNPVTRFHSAVIPLPAENVDTDQVVPARYLKTTDKSDLAAVLFHDWRYTQQGTFREPRFVLDQPGMAGRSILLVGANFGAGSSREHAAWALWAWGVRALISTAFADIFAANALKNGLLPIVVDAPTHARLLDLLAAAPDTELGVDLAAGQLSLPVGPAIDFVIEPFARAMLLAGTDEIGYVLARLPEIEDWEATHPSAGDTRFGQPQGD